MLHNNLSLILLREITLSSAHVTYVKTAPDGLAAEMMMLDHVARHKTHAFGFVWQAKSRALVLPERFSRTPNFASAATTSARAKWPVTTRKTGGGITPQGPGVLNVAIAFNTKPGQSRTIRESYAAICNPLIEGLKILGVSTHAAPIEGSFCDGEYNLAIGMQKLVGTAQRWRGNTCLCHALIMTDLEIEPAVNAVANLSSDLQHDTLFQADKHCRLADFITSPPKTNLTEWIALSLWSALEAYGFTRWINP